MTERPEQRPEGRLIAAASKSSPLSVREAAAEAGIGDGRWYQIVRGYQTISQGVYAPVRGPADTLAKMARAVGVTPEQLENAERQDAAEELRLLLGEDAESPRASSDTRANGSVRLTVIVNPEDPEPDYPPGGLRDQIEGIIWAMRDEPWHVRWAQIQARRATLVPAEEPTEKDKRRMGRAE